MFISKGGFILVLYCFYKKFPQTQGPITSPIFYLTGLQLRSPGGFSWFLCSSYYKAKTKLTTVRGFLLEVEEGSVSKLMHVFDWIQFFCSCQIEVPVSLQAVIWDQFLLLEATRSLYFVRGSLQQQGIESLCFKSLWLILVPSLSNSRWRHAYLLRAHVIKVHPPK